MKLSKIYLLLLVILVNNPFSYSQANQQLDSILSRAHRADNWQDQVSIYSKGITWAKEHNNSSGVGLLYFNMGVIYFRNSKNDSALSCYRKSLPYLLKNKNAAIAGKVYNNLALLKRNEADSALYFASLSLKYRRLSKDTLEVANSHLLLGDIYDERGIFSLSLQHYLSATRIYEKEKFQTGLINVYNNLGVLYGKMNEQKKRLHYQQLAVGLLKQQDDMLKLASGYNNLANTYTHLKLYDSALFIHSLALKIRKEKNNIYDIAATNYNIADVYFQQEECDKALPFIQSAVTAFEQANPVIAHLYGYHLYGKILDCKGSYTKSAPLLHKAHETSIKYRALPEKKDILMSLAEHYHKKREFSKAYEYRLLYETTKDSLLDQEKVRVVKEMETGFDAEKRELQIRTLKQEKELQDKELAVTTAKEQEQRVISYSVTAGLGLVLLFSIFVFNRLQLTKRQKLVIEQQKYLVETQKQLVDEKNKEITDSINYAKRLQTAILPPQKLISHYFKESFILYKPKDIVAGDFYWFETAGDKIFLAAADCTGHGVPGAMMSVVCSNALTKTIRELGILEPGKMLDKAAGILEEHFSRSEVKVTDGMDVSLCTLSPSGRGQGEVILQWSGANNPLYLIRKKKLQEIRGNKQPVGSFENRQLFTSHTIELQKGDIIYLFTDGYADQFGGEKGKKFKYSKLKELLLAISEKPMSEQKQILDETFETWKGNLEQVDDVCIIGVRI